MHYLKSSSSAAPYIGTIASKSQAFKYIQITLYIYLLVHQLFTFLCLGVRIQII